MLPVHQLLNLCRRQLNIQNINGCVPFYWETGGDMNRGTGTAKEAYAIEGIMKGAAAGKYPY